MVEMAHMAQMLNMEPMLAMSTYFCLARHPICSSILMVPL